MLFSVVMLFTGSANLRKVPGGTNARYAVDCNTTRISMLICLSTKIWQQVLCLLFLVSDVASWFFCSLSSISKFSRIFQARFTDKFMKRKKEFEVGISKFKLRLEHYIGTSDEKKLFVALISAKMDSKFWKMDGK